MAMKARRLQALRSLAERPGTPAEGEVAREMLAKLEAKRSAAYPAGEIEAWSLFGEYLHQKDMEILRRAMREAAARMAEVKS